MLTNNFYLAVAGQLACNTEANRYDMIGTDGKKITNGTSYVTPDNFITELWRFWRTEIN